MEVWSAASVVQRVDVKVWLHGALKVRRRVVDVAKLDAWRHKPRGIEPWSLEALLQACMHGALEARCRRVAVEV